MAQSPYLSKHLGVRFPMPSPEGRLLGGGCPPSDVHPSRFVSSAAWPGATGAPRAQDPEALSSFLPHGFSYKPLRSQTRELMTWPFPTRSSHGLQAARLFQVRLSVLHRACPGAPFPGPWSSCPVLPLPGSAPLHDLQAPTAERSCPQGV